MVLQFLMPKYKVFLLFGYQWRPVRIFKRAHVQVYIYIFNTYTIATVLYIA